MSSRAFAERILRFVHAKGYKPRQLDELAAAMGIGEAEQGDFHTACKALMKTGRVVLGSRSALMPSAPRGKMTGTFRANRRGFGFVIPDTPNSHGDLYVPPGATGGAITGDRVSATVKKRGKRHGEMLYEGRIVAVLERGQSRFVGELRHSLGRWFVVPDGQTLHGPILVPDAKGKNAKAGDQIVIEITRYPSDRLEAQGAIVKVLGKRGEPSVDAQSIVEQYQLPGEFPEAVLDEARAAVAGFEPAVGKKNREDLRKLTIITIDPADAGDFDDAISLVRNDNGTTELGVHIADVAHFVPEGGALDTEARERASSVYLPRLVIPMLPETLSNGVCSLQERQPRLTKSVFITYDGRGKVKKTRMANTIIRSTKRLTYEQATKILEGKPGRTSPKVVALLQDMDKLARTIRKRRLGEGMLVLDLPEGELVHDDDGRVIDVVPADTSFSHTIIEMFMVEANEAIARTLDGRKVPFLRRIHEDPSGSSDGTLRRFVRALGHDLPDDADRRAIQGLLDRVRGKPESFAVSLAVLRSLQQAEYSPTRVGHYALASEHYCHFTSPIRRYPDLTIHRLVDRYLAGGFQTAKDRREVCSAETLLKLGRHCSANERRAEAAERELRLVLVLRLLDNHLGEPLDGVVTGVANVGVFVQLERYLIDGLVRFDSLPDDWWEVDVAHGAIVGQRSGRRINIGDRMKVTIARIHLPTRQLDLAPAETANHHVARSHHPGTAGGHTRRKSSRAPIRKGSKTPKNTHRTRSKGKRSTRSR